MGKRTDKKKTQDAAVVIGIGASLLLYSAYGFFCGRVKHAWILSPYLFPMLIALFALLLGVCMLLGDGGKEPDGETGAEGQRAAAAVVLAGAYCAAMSVFPFALVTAAFLAGAMWFMGERRWKVILSGSVLVSAALYLLFAVGLNVRLP